MSPAPTRRRDRTWAVVTMVVTVVLAAGTISIALRGGPSAIEPAGQPPSPPRPGGTPPQAQLVRFETSAAAAHPAATGVAALLERHFTAINSRDYDAWVGTVTAERAADQPRSGWLAAYRSTWDDEIVIREIAGGGDRHSVVLTFTSVQDPADAPADLPVGRICWTSTWPIRTAGTDARIDTPSAGATTKRAC